MFTFEGACESDDAAMVEIPHALYFLFDVFDEVGLLGELSLIDALDRVDLILGRF
jgi:hypothetical protein